MPSTSQKQHNLMAAAANSAAFAKKAGIDPKVAQEFLDADKGGQYDRSKANRAKKRYGAKK